MGHDVETTTNRGFRLLEGNETTGGLVTIMRKTVFLDLETFFNQPKRLTEL